MPTHPSVEALVRLSREPNPVVASTDAWNLAHALARRGRVRELDDLFHLLPIPNPMRGGIWEVDWISFPVFPRLRLLHATAANVLRLWPRPLPWFHLVDPSTQTGDTCPVWWTKKLCQLSVPGYEMPDIAGGAGFSMFPFLMRQDISPLAPHRPTLQFDYRAAQRGEPRGPVHWLARHAHVDVVQIVPGVNLARLLIHIGTHRWWHTGHYVHRLLDQ